jgi:sulfate transport system substrate-binding protein
MENNQISPKLKHPRRIIPIIIFSLLLLVVFFYFIRTDLISENKPPIQLVVYAYSIQEEVFTQGIFPAFIKDWETSSDTELTIMSVFGPAGSLAGQISLGAPADIAIFSSDNYLNYLVISRQVEPDIQPFYFGESPLVIATRPGNPKTIRNFSDLAQADLALVQADPRSSGIGELSLLAVYGSQYLTSGDQASGLNQVREIWKNVDLLAPSARSSLMLFEMGAGEALITYEQDARLAQAQGMELEIVVPSPTLLSQPVAIAVESNIIRSEKEAVEAFLAFLVSPQAQEIFSDYYLRPINPLLADRFQPVDSFTATDLGGWPDTFSQLVEPFWEKEILPNLSLEEGYTIYLRENK